jgi:hypothetical protein
VKPLLGCLLGLFAMCASSRADDWDPNDDTFDPRIQSVVIGDSSWLGDPSPFLFMGLARTGYTHVNQVNWEGYDPSIQIALMVPQKDGETQPPAGGMLLLNHAQGSEFIKVLEGAVKAQPKQKRTVIKTGMKDAHWALTCVAEEGQRFLQLESKSQDQVDVYRFSVNASKKLLGAMRHFLEKLEKTSEK